MAPSNLRLVQKTAYTIELAWDVVENSTSYKLEKDGVVTVISGSQNNTYTYTNLDADTPYSFRIRSVNDFGTSQYSNTINITTDNDLPEAPTGIFFNNVTENSVTINWDAALRADYYQVLRRLQGQTAWSSIANNVNNTFYTNNGVGSGNTYEYIIRSWNNIGSADSTIESVTIDQSIPDAPTLSVSSFGEDFISLSWTVSSQADNYRVEVKYPEGTSFIALTTKTGTTHTLNNAQSGSEYSFRVVAINSAGTATSNVVTQTTDSGIQPVAAPTLSLGTVSGNDIPLSWSSSANATSYDVMVLLPGASTYTLQTNLTNTSYTFTGNPDSEYSFKVVAKNSDSQAESNVVTATTEVEIPTQFLLSGYPLTETTGDAIDYGSGGYDMQVFGSMVRNGSNYEYNGSNTYLKVSGATGHSFVKNGQDTAFTFRCSIKWKSFYRGFIIARRVGSAGGEYQLWYDSGILQLWLIGNDTIADRMVVSVDLSTIANLNTWYRLAVTYDASKNRAGMKIHLNGVRVDTGTSGNATYSGMKSTVADTRIGAPEFNGGYRMSVFLKYVNIDKEIEFSQSQLEKDYQDASL
ncbi:fibronectin type III domain-containing protein [Christiangramia forsetii]|uniref:fibronectin type III domain-containing protein n=1 Tax=Christiangramia forsetii TaxID=411153 RepID=UPI00130521B6|nr:fibronectin type III domain-containing protein [Christiangramia forsetii]